MADNEKQFETDIESFLISPKGGWQKATDAGYKAGFQYDSAGALIENYALDIPPRRPAAAPAGQFPPKTRRRGHIKKRLFSVGKSWRNR